MKFTGEFFVPSDAEDSHTSNPELEVEHKQRYQSILSLAQGKNVLDIASGEGYGTFMLSSVAGQVWGVDINPELVAYASQKYGRENNRFLHGSATSIPLEAGLVDLVVSFETLEHISAEDQVQFFKEVRRVLKPGGTFIVSTPNKKNYTDRYDHHNEFHVHELEREGFEGLLKSSFQHVRVYEQGMEIVSVILNKEEFLLKKPVLPVSVNPENYHFEGKYLIGIGSDQPGSIEQSLASFVPESERSYFQMIDRILELQDQVEKLGAWGRRSTAELEAADEKIAALSQEVEKLGAWGTRSSAELAAAEEKLASISPELERLGASGRSLESELQQAKNDYAALQARFEEQLVSSTHLTEQAEVLQRRIDTLTREKEIQDRSIQQYYRSNYDLKRQLQKLQDEQGARKETESHRLYKLEAEKKELETRLQDIYSSDGYRLLSIYYRFKGKYLPDDSPGLLRLKKIGRFLKSNKVVSKLRNKGKIPSVKISEAKLAKDHNIVPEVPAGVVFPIVFPVAENPVVSIVIPAYNNWAYTRNCLISIYQLTDDVSYEVIVGDNVSTDETVNLEKYFTNVVYLRNPENLGYIKNVNNAASHARGRFILTLNNDTTVTRGWLSSLVDVMDRDPKAGLVGSKLVYPNGLMQEAGGIIWRDASGWNYGREGNPEAPEYNYLKEVDYVSGASNLIRKEIWDRLKGLDERYVPAYFDDSDLAFSIRGLGYKTVYQPLSVVIHYEGMAHGTDTSSGTKKYQVVNREKFIEKWKAVLGTENFPNGENVFHARDKSKGKKTIVVIDHYVPHFDKDAGSRTTFQLLNLFVRLNYNVKFIGDNFYKHEPYTTILQQMGIEVLYGEYYRDNWKQWIINNKKYIDYFYVNRPHISIKYIDFLRQNTNAKIVYYGHDLHFVRERLQYEIEKDPTLLASIEQWKKTETEIIRQSDTVLTLSYDEKEIIEKEIGHADVRIMPAFSYSRFNEPVTNFDQRKNILFVGGFGHKPNVDAVLWFAREVFPLVRRELKDVEFVIAGSKPPEEVTKLASSYIEVKGYVSDEELVKLYQNTKMVVIPLRYGAGVKGKTVEAMYHGIPFVTSRFGIEGLQNIKDVTTSNDSADQFATAILGLYNDAGKLQDFSRREIEYSRKYFSEDNVNDLILRTFS